MIVENNPIDELLGEPISPQQQDENDKVLSGTIEDILGTFDEQDIVTALEKLDEKHGLGSVVADILSVFDGTEMMEVPEKPDEKPLVIPVKEEYSPEKDLIDELLQSPPMSVANGAEAGLEVVPLMGQEAAENVLPSTSRIDPKKLLVTMHGGTKYLPAQARAFLFRMYFPLWSIETEVLEYIPDEMILAGNPRNTNLPNSAGIIPPMHIAGRATVTAYVKNEEGRIMGMARKTWSAEKNPKLASFVLEAAESGAISRAIAVATGIGMLSGAYDFHEMRMTEKPLRLE